LKSERRDIEYIGQYRCSARAKETLRRGEAYVDSAMVDWSLFAEFADEFSLDVERDNKSVWDPRWLVRGLARFGSSIPATLATKFRRPEPLRAVRSPRGASNQEESPGLPANAGPRAVGEASRRKRGRSDFDFTFLDGGRAVLSDRRTRSIGGSGTPGFDPAIYERAKAATFRMAGGRSRRYLPLSENEVVDKVLHLDKSAGAPFFCNTSLILDRGIQRSRDVRAGRIGFDPYVAYRRIQHGSSGPKGRLVWGSPLATTILAASFAKAAYKGLVRRHCFSYGYQKAEVGAFISEFQAVARRVYCLDFSGFDSTVPAFVIGDAFDIVHSHLLLDAEETDLFYRLTNDFIHSRIVLPDASIYQKHRGIPSGSPFTSIVGSICNLIILNYIWIRLTDAALKEDRVLVLGDDSIVATNSIVSLDSIARVANELGMEVSVSKSKVAARGDRVEFLGHEWENARPHRPRRDVAIRLVFEEKHRPRDITMTYMRLYGFTSDCFEAYDMVIELIHSPGMDISDSLHRLATMARGSPMDLGELGIGRLRYLISHEPELLPHGLDVNAKLAAVGIKY
jgi:hypothetical protein